jgi:hypothetical protein
MGLQDHRRLPQCAGGQGTASNVGDLPMTPELLLLAQATLGALSGGIAGFIAGRQSNDPRFWAPLLLVSLVAGLGNGLTGIPFNPVPLVLGVPGLIACVVSGIVAMELGLWSAGSERVKVRGKR